MSTRSCRGTAVGASLIALLACAESPQEALPQWALGEPSVVLGSVDGGPTAFSEVGALAVGPTSALYVALPQDHVVRVFDREGAYVGSVGREGNGPGEFQRPGPIGFLGDTLWVLDVEARRASFFLGGDLLRTEGYPDTRGLHGERIAYPRAVVSNADFLVATDVRLPFQPAVTDEPGVLYRYDGSRFDTIAVVDVDHTNGFLVRGTPAAIEALAPFKEPFRAGGIWATSSDGSVLAIADRMGAPPNSYSVTVLTTEGDMVSSSFRPYDPIPVPSSVMDSALAASVAPGFDVSDVREAAYVPDSYPPVSRVIVGPDTLVWLGGEERPGRGREWQVLSVHGDPVAELVAPVGFDLRLIEDDHVWGLVTDELDVPYLVKRRIIRE